MVGLRELAPAGDRQGHLLSDTLSEGGAQNEELPFAEPVQRVVRPVFGSMASIGIVGTINTSAIEACFARLEEIEARFSPYRPESEISRIRDRALPLASAHAETRKILEVCAALGEESGGLFDAWHASLDGRLDPSGYVKGWAIGEAIAILRDGGMSNVALGIGGDVAAIGGGATGIGWSVGVVDPGAPTLMMARVALRSAAIATSGLAERPDHLRDPRRGTVIDSPWISFTVVGPDIARVDALATICFLEGRGGLDRVDALPGYGALAMQHDRTLLATEGFRSITI